MSPDLHHLSGAYAVDALDEAERASFEEHLAVCPDCRAEVAELSGAAAQLSALTEATPPPALRAAVLRGITQVRPLPPLADPATASPAAEAPVAATHDSPPSVPDAVPTADVRRSGGTVVPFRRRASTWLAVAAAAAAIVVGGLAWGPWTAPASPMDQVVSAADAAKVSQTKGSMTAELAYSRQLGKGAITVAGLPPAPSGKAYQLWYVGADGVARSAGLMDADADGRGSMMLEGDPSKAAAVGMTVEPAGGSPHPTSDPLVVLALS